jgi:hypothetical protein
MTSILEKGREVRSDPFRRPSILAAATGSPIGPGCVLPHRLPDSCRSPQAALQPHQLLIVRVHGLHQPKPATEMLFEDGHQDYDVLSPDLERRPSASCRFCPISSPAASVNPKIRQTRSVSRARTPCSCSACSANAAAYANRMATEPSKKMKSPKRKTRHSKFIAWSRPRATVAGFPSSEWMVPRVR